MSAPEAADGTHDARLVTLSGRYLGPIAGSGAQRIEGCERPGDMIARFEVFDAAMRDRVTAFMQTENDLRRRWSATSCASTTSRPWTWPAGPSWP